MPKKLTVILRKALVFSLTFLSIIYAQNWEHHFKICPSDSVNGEFGYSVAVYDDYAVIGDPEKSAVYVYNYNGSTWQLMQELTPDTLGWHMHFGNSVAIDENHIVIGAEDAGIGQAGNSFVFLFNGSSWIFDQKIKYPEDSGDYSINFGSSVAVSDSIIVISDDGFHGGRVYVYKKGISTWEKTQVLSASDSITIWPNSFGCSVSLSGNRILIGDRGYSENADSSALGAAYVYNYIDSSFVMMQKLKANDGAPLDNFGESVSIYDNYAIIGAPYEHYDTTPSPNPGSGAAYIFYYDDTEWKQVQKVKPSVQNPYGYFGNCVSIFDNYAIVGEYQETEEDTIYYVGSAHIYSREGTNWSEQMKVQPDDIIGWQYFGHSVAINDKHALMGKPGDITQADLTSGEVYVLSNYLEDNIRDVLTINENTFQITGIYPSPFNPTTTIEYKIKVGSEIKIDVYNLNGKLINNLVNEYVNEGTYKIKFDGSDLSSGLYLVTLRASNYSECKKILLLK